MSRPVSANRTRKTPSVAEIREQALRVEHVERRHGGEAHEMSFLGRRERGSRKPAGPRTALYDNLASTSEYDRRL